MNSDVPCHAPISPLLWPVKVSLTLQQREKETFKVPIRILAFAKVLPVTQSIDRLINQSINHNNSSLLLATLSGQIIFVSKLRLLMLQAAGKSFPRWITKEKPWFPTISSSLPSVIVPTRQWSESGSQTTPAFFRPASCQLLGSCPVLTTWPFPKDAQTQTVTSEETAIDVEFLQL